MVGLLSLDVALYVSLVYQSVFGFAAIIYDILVTGVWIWQGYDVVQIACPERHVTGLDISQNAINKALQVRLTSPGF